MSSVPSPRTRRPAFTVIELLLVVVAVAILIALVTPKVLRERETRRADAAQAQMDTIAAALEAYRRDVGRYPTAAQGIPALWQVPTADPRPSTWHGPYLPRRPRMDPWDRRFVYRSPGESNAGTYDLLSHGADGKPGGTGAGADIIHGKKP